MVEIKKISMIAAWETDAKLVPIKDFRVSKVFSKSNTPFFSWRIDLENKESVVGVGNGISQCKYFVSRRDDISLNDLISEPVGNVGSLCSIINAIANVANGEDDASGQCYAGCNFEVKITLPLDNGTWYFYVVAIDKNGNWGVLE